MLILLGCNQMALDELSTGWKIWPDSSFTPNRSIFLLCSGKFTYICHFKRVGINVKKSESKRIHFNSDVFHVLANIPMFPVFEFIKRWFFHFGFTANFEGGKVSEFVETIDLLLRKIADL